MQSSRARDLLAGGVFVAIGLAFALGSRTYEIGTALQMGPGYVPFAFACLLVGLGLVIAAQGLLAGLVHETPSAGTDGPGTAEDQDRRVPWRSVALLVVALVVFGFSVRDVGLVPALLVATFLAALAGHRTGVLLAAAVAVGLTVLCVLVFVLLLQLRLPLLGPWLGG